MPALVYLLHFPIHIATATSLFVLTMTAFTGSATHIAAGLFHHGIRRADCTLHRCHPRRSSRRLAFAPSPWELDYSQSRHRAGVGRAAACRDRPFGSGFEISRGGVRFRR